MTHASLFSGIGGFDYAAALLGWINIFDCEIDAFCRKVLGYHFPNSVHYGDITKQIFKEWRGKIDVLSGGFPCQPFSLAGQRKGADDNRYLWPEMLRVIREILPRWVVGENVGGILTMVQPGAEVEVGGQASLFGEDYRKRVLHRQEYVIETICRDLEREGYAVQPLLIPACAVGAPHRRDRIWFIAHRTNAGVETMQFAGENGIYAVGVASNPNRDRCRNWTNKQKLISECERKADYCYGCKDGVATYSDGDRHTSCETSYRTEKERRERAAMSGQRGGRCERFNGLDGFSWDVTDTNSKGLQGERIYEKHSETKKESFNKQSFGCIRTTWQNFPTQSPICSGDDGISGRLDGITFSKWRQESVKAYGNAVLPQVVYEIFRAINIVENGRMEND